MMPVRRPRAPQVLEQRHAPLREQALPEQALLEQAWLARSLLKLSLSKDPLPQHPLPDTPNRPLGATRLPPEFQTSAWTCAAALDCAAVRSWVA